MDTIVPFDISRIIDRTWCQKLVKDFGCENACIFRYCTGGGRCVSQRHPWFEQPDLTVKLEIEYVRPSTTTRTYKNTRFLVFFITNNKTI